MSVSRLAIIILIFSTFLLLTASVSPASRFMVTGIYDGDTIKVATNGKEINVRLAGIDAPEKSKNNQPGQPYSEMAAKFLEVLVLNKTVEIKTYGIDRHNNTLGVVFLKGKNINFKMLKAGLAEVCSENLPKDFNLKPYHWREAEAKKAGRGIWNQGDEYISPSEWRKQKKK